MPVRVVSGPAGGVADSLVRHLREAALADPWERHTVLVPNQRAAEILALRVGEAGGAFGLDILTPAALAGRLVAPDAAKAPSAAERLLVMAAVVDRLRWPRASPSLAATLVALRDELATGGASPAEARRTGAVGERAFRALEAFDAALDGRPQPADVLRLAALRVRRSQARPPAHLDLWALSGLTGAEATLVAACVMVGDVRAYLAAPAAGVPESPAALRLRRALGVGPLGAVGQPPPTELVATANAAAEADAAARLLVSLTAEAALHRIACVGPRAGLARVAERLAALGAPVRRAPSPLREGAAGATLGLLLEVWAEDRVEALAALLAGPGDSVDAPLASALADRLLRTPGAGASQRLAVVAGDDGAGAAQDMAILLRSTLAALAGARTWAAWAGAAREGLEALCGDALDAREASAALAVLARLGALDGPRRPAPTPGLAAACLAAELSAPLPPAPLERAPVELLAFEEAGALAADAVVLFGVAAEDVGHAAADASLLAEQGRGILALGGWPVDGPDDTASHRQFAAALARAGAARVAAVYVAQGQTGERPAAAFLAPARAVLAPDVPLDVVESRRRLARGRAVDVEVWRALGAAGGPLATPARALAAAAASFPTAWDGQIRPPLPPAPEAGWSATLLEAYGRCPYQDFLARLLGMDEDEEQDALDDAEPAPSEIGQVAHSALEHLRRAARSEEREPLAAADMPWVRERLGEALDAAFERLPATPLAPVHRAALLDELAHAVLLGIEAGDLTTLDSEWAFGPHGAGSLVLTLGDGRRVVLRGRIDRVAEERAAGHGRGRLWVVDYKSGRSLPKADITPENLQLALYMLAVADAWHRDVADVNGSYVSVTARGGYAQATLAGPDLKARRGELDRAVAAILDGMEGGRFGPRPRNGRNCRSCRFRPVCPGDVAARARRKGLDPDAPEAAEGGEGA